MSGPVTSERVPPAPATVEREPMATLARLVLLVAAVVAVFLVSSRWNQWSGGAAEPSTDDAFLQTDITPIGVKVAGYVLEAPVGDFTKVHRGDLLAVLVPDDYRAQLAQQEASVAAAAAGLINNTALAELQRANVRAARAVTESAVATLSRSRSEAVRQRRLAVDGAGTEQTREAADTGERQSEALLEQSRAQLLSAERQLTVLAAQRLQIQATFESARANRDVAALNLSYTRVTAPEDGVTGARQVRIGQFVSVGQQVAVIAALPRMWVIANFKETQVRDMRVGQSSTIEVDAFPGLRIRGHVVSLSPGTGSQFALLPPDNATGNFTKVVQRIAVKIGIDDAGELGDLLRPGMSVAASVRVRP